MDTLSLGFTKPLYILPFDHRATFAEKMFNLNSSMDLNQEQKHLIREFKMIIYKGFKDAIDKGIPTDKGAVLCDEEYGSEVLLDAKQNGFITMLTIEKSGEKEFKFQYEDFKEHIERLKPTFTKVLIKYNPEDPEDLRKRQKDNLKLISDYSHGNNYKFLLEALVIPTEIQLASVGGKREEFDEKMRPGLTVEVIKELQDAGIEPDVWKLEGFDEEQDYKGVVEAARRGGRDNVSLVILGRGANEEKVDKWLEIGAKTEGIIGFAVGRTVFWESLERFYKGEIGKAEAIETISENFTKFYNIFISSKP